MLHRGWHSPDCGKTCGRPPQGLARRSDATAGVPPLRGRPTTSSCVPRPFAEIVERGSGASRCLSFVFREGRLAPRQSLRIGRDFDLLVAAWIGRLQWAVVVARFEGDADFGHTAVLGPRVQGARFRVASALAGRIAASPRVCDLGSGYERRRTARLPSKIRPRV